MSNRQLPFRLHFAGLIFNFETKKQLMEWIEINMAYATDRRGMYEAVMFDSAGAAMALSKLSTDAGDMDITSIMRAASVIFIEYGKTYDPQGEVFVMPEEQQRQLGVWPGGASNKRRTVT